MFYTIKERTDPRMQGKRRLPGGATSCRVWVSTDGARAGSTARPVLSFVYSESTTTEGLSRYQA